jgi:hypothetical protein
MLSFHRRNASGKKVSSGSVKGNHVSDVRRIATIHAGASDTMRNELLGHIEQALLAAGVSRVWIDPEIRPDLAVMVDLTDLGAESGMADLPGTAEATGMDGMAVVPEVADLPLTSLD